MRISKGVPDPGRLARQTAGKAGGVPTAKTEGAGRKSGAGILGGVASPPSRSTAGVLVEALREGHLAGTSGPAAGKQETAWTNVAHAVASAGRSVAGIGGPAAPGKAAIQKLPIGTRKALVDTIGAVKQGATEGARSAFEKVVEGGTPNDVHQYIQHVVRESYLENCQDLASVAEKVKSFNDQKQSIRDRLSKLRGGATSSAVADQIKGWEEKLQTVGDDAQLANIDMQSALQRQQQTLQMMSNVSKVLHDTAMAVVRKIG